MKTFLLYVICILFSSCVLANDVKNIPLDIEDSEDSACQLIQLPHSCVLRCADGSGLSMVVVDRTNCERLIK